MRLRYEPYKPSTKARMGFPVVGCHGAPVTQLGGMMATLLAQLTDHNVAEPTESTCDVSLLVEDFEGSVECSECGQWLDKRGECEDGHIQGVRYDAAGPL